MPVSELETLTALAVSAANQRRTPRAPLAWSRALREAPWLSLRMPATYEHEFRRAYATALLARGMAIAAKPPGASGKSGKSVLKRRKISGTPREFREQDKRAEVAGLDWARWARRKLAEP